MFAKPSWRRPAKAKRSVRPRLEVLEDRNLMAAVTVNLGTPLRTVNDHVLGVNLTNWDTNINTARTQQLVQAAGLTMFRFPGGSSSDTFHFNARPAYNGQGTVASMASFIAGVGGTGLVTIDYGTGSPQEAAAMLAYLNGSVNNTTIIGSGQEWNAASSSWVQIGWGTASYWAQLRAATPLAPDDGLNFLRAGRAAPFGIHYFEVGNEIYGSWETDEHGSGGDTGKAHDPATYVKFAKQFAAYAAQINPTISIGEVTGSVSYDNSWTANVLQQDVSQGLTPGFLSDHIYVQAPGSETDTNLLFDTVSSSSAGGSGSPDNWLLRANDYRNLLNTVLGAKASSVELLATEFNSVYANPGKQSTSLVNGLFIADALGGLLKTEYNGADVWDLRNGWSSTGENNSASLYGWRQGGDYGILGSGSGPAPSTGTYVPYPTYFAEQIVSEIAHNGDTVVYASSSDTNLDVVAVKQTNGHLDLLVINKSATASVTGQFQTNGFTPGTQAQLWQYGMAQDTAQSQTTDGHSALANSTVSLTVTGSAFNYAFPAYSMSVLDLAPTNVPTSTLVTASASSVVYGQTITFTATVSANSAAPTGSVEFFDTNSATSLRTDLGPGALQSSATGHAIWTYTPGPTQLKVAATGTDTIQAVFSSTGSFAGSNGTLASGPGPLVTPRPLTITAATNTKAYDGTTAASAAPTVTNLVAGDSVMGLVETYDTPALGTGKTLIPTGTVNDGNGGKNYTVSFVNDTTGAIVAGPFKKFVVGILGASTVTAGTSVLVTVQAADEFGNPVTPNGATPITVALAASPLVPTGTMPASVMLTSGFGFFIATFTKVNSDTITATDTADAVAGTSSRVTVTPANAAYFTVTPQSPTAVTGAPFNVTVQAFDPFQNVATNYAGLIHLSSSDAKATLPSDGGLNGGSGTFAVTLNTAGSQTITASDNLSFKPITISGSALVDAGGLMVTSLTKTATGFTAAFNKAINPADLTIYGTGNTQQDVLLIGQNSNNGQPYPGTLIVDAGKQLVTFNVSSNFLVASSPGGSAALPDDTYTVTLLCGSGNNGFQDAAGQGFDDGHGGHADFVGTFTTTYQQDKTAVLGIADFARGPSGSGDTSTLIKVPNDPSNGGHIGIPITVYNAVNLSSAGFTLTYNANILTVTAGKSDPSTATSVTFRLTSNVLAADGIHSVATFSVSFVKPLSGTQLLGDVIAYVPYSARTYYKAMDLLTLGNISVSGGATVLPANAVDVNAYFGDVNGDHHLDGVDKGLIANVASTASTGFSAFTLLDPAIIGDLSGDNAVTANSTSLLSNYLLGLPVAKIPALPNPPIADSLFTSANAPASNAPAAALAHLFAAAASRLSANGLTNSKGGGSTGGSVLNPWLDWAAVLADGWDPFKLMSLFRFRR